jgi:hypothetical protein
MADPVASYESFRVLLDDPADEPRLGFDVYADAFAQIIEHSKPHFAVGIFGDWGSGKTTLMRAIEHRIAAKPDQMLPVWFNAWRYEREVHLIVPLLDNLREALLAWSKKHGDKTVKAKAQKAAKLFGRAALALLRGISIQGGIPGAEGTVDFDKVIENLTAASPPASFYHAAFTDMREASEAFGTDRRIVVFIDDLDRCTPTNALQVLEAMKLFFDFAGFIFVVGLDQSVIERSVEAKYQADSPQPSQVVIASSSDENGGARGPIRAASTKRPTPISGGDYIKKLFQVPFSLPRIDTNQLADLLNALATAGSLPPEQVNDLRNTVFPHLRYISDRDVVNPREIKRLINGYVLQMKLLAPRLGRNTSPDRVLAIQLLAFRPDWRALYEVLADDPDEFAAELREGLQGAGGGGLSVGEEGTPVPQSFVTYVRQHGRPMLDEPSLRPYVSSAEQTQAADPAPRLASQTVRGLRRLMAQTAETGNPATARDALSETSVLRERLEESRRSSQSRQPFLVEDALKLCDRFEREVEQLAISEIPTGEVATRVRASQATLEQISDVIREMRRQAGPALL